MKTFVYTTEDIVCFNSDDYSFVFRKDTKSKEIELDADKSYLWAADWNGVVKALREVAEDIQTRFIVNKDRNSYLMGNADDWKDVE